MKKHQVVRGKIVASKAQGVIPKVRIEPKLRDLLPPLTPHEFKVLEDNISKQGVLHPLVVWRGQNVLIDGHNRYAICNKLKITPRIKYKDFDTVNDAMLWIIEFQDASRQLNAFQRCELRYKHKQLYLDKAAKNSNSFKKVPEDQKIQTNVILANRAGVSSTYFMQASMILERADPLLKEKCRTGLVPVTDAYKIIMSKEREKRPKSDLKGVTVQLPIEHFEILSRMGAARKQNISEMIRIAVRYYLENSKE